MSEPKRPNRIEELKNKVAQSKPAMQSPRRLDVPQTQAPAKPKPGAKPKGGTETGRAVNHKCGHPILTKVLANQDCPKCAKARRLANAGKKRDGQHQKRLDRPAATNKGRLPAGSEFHLFWDGKSWKGNLLTPDAPASRGEEGQPQELPTETGYSSAFRGENTGVFRLMEQLDAKFRESRKPTEQASPCPPPAEGVQQEPQEKEGKQE